ncbi:meiotically up-regulated gene 9 protein [Chaetomidium leptoderma]|uniref:Meiotically up-regulated gene 9 protein n=1 Tax=Chaetomidium leptoderma TaxID=669021 RepID=A0AAN6VMJ7_9PEZI|nr:meiotically up-regulated gene 9 protein [Chaetomidium leptoderma]
MAIANPHPPPAHPYQLQQAPPPQHAPQLHLAQQRPTGRTRKPSTFSFRSDKSHGSGSHHKIDLHETSAEKEAKRLHSKADPTLAMQEAEPSEVAATGESSLAPLRSIQHKDPLGNPIAEPDRSNPTRSRWERPLDTIRSFEAAIDGGYSNRKSIIRPGTINESHGNASRFAHDSYYSSRPPSMMYATRADGSQPDLRPGGMGQRDSYYDQQAGYGGHGPTTQNGRRGWPRMASEPQYGSSYRQQNPNDYSNPNNHRSYETVGAGSGSGSSAEPAGYQTDPTSSDNSSIERGQSAVPRRQPEPVNDYGIGFGQSPSYHPPSFTVGIQNPGMNGQASGGYNYANPAPPVPRKDPGPVLRKPMATGNAQAQQARPAQPEKRKSWFARRFSKHG